MKRILPLFILIILMTSCHHTPQAMYALESTGGEAVPPPPQSSVNQPQPVDKIEKQEVIKKKIIRDGQMSLQVKDIGKTRLRIDTLVTKFEGYYDNESVNNFDWGSSYHLSIRIPSANFGKFISAIETGYGEIQHKEINARDVTDQFIDLETRLENKRNYLKRYNDLLKKANNVNEILEIEEKIRGLEEEIESTTGKLKYLNDLVDYSTLDLTLSSNKDFKYTPGNRDKFSEKLKQSLSKGWFGFIDFLVIVVRIWPFWIILTVILYFVLKYNKKKRIKQAR
jgi:hypothetical protein